MTPDPLLTTDRLQLRAWRDSDLPKFAALNADPRVMEFFTKTLDRETSDAMAKRIRTQMTAQGFGLWGVEAFGVDDFVGFVGLNVPTFTAHFTPCVEIGWRLAQAYWGFGYASEAARAALAFGFERLQLPEIVSFTATINVPSQRVMQRIGMHTDPAENFDHPMVPAGHRLETHVLYRLRREEFKGAE